MLLAVIAGCEIGFWVLLGAGLVTRYLLRRPRLGGLILLCVPLVDLVLFVATVLDLRGGTVANETHGLAAVYIGFSVAFGHRTIRWADERFAHRWAGGPPPGRPPRYGAARTRYEWGFWFRMLLGWLVSCALLLGGIALAGNGGPTVDISGLAVPERTAALWAWIARLTVTLLIALIWPVSYTIWPKQPKDGAAAR
jgi:hypothetical protein